MPLPNSREIARLSRDPRFLVRACLFLVVLALMLSGTIAALWPAKEVPRLEKDPSLITIGADLDPDLTAPELAGVIRNRMRVFFGQAPRDFREMELHRSGRDDRSPDYEAIERRIESSTALNEGERERLLLLLEGLHGRASGRENVIGKLLAIPEDRRYRNEFLGDVYLAAERPEKGIHHYLEEGKRFGEATYSRRSALVAYIEREEIAPLRAALELDGFRDSLGPHDQIAASSLLGEYGRMLVDIFLLDWSQLLSPETLIALFTASIWFSILLILGHLTRPQVGWGLLAFFLGVISTTLTLYFVYLQEHVRNFVHHPEDTLLNQLIAMIAGIGLREETLKLLCFIPVAFGILRYRSPLLALVTAAMTGLGFAAMENVQYFVESPDDFVAWGRLLSANALHFCLTGIAGHSFYQVLLRRGRGWENFLIDFLLVVFIHGIYDGLILIPQLQEYSIINIIILAGTAYRFLDLVRGNMPSTGQLRRISPLGVFVLGSALLACGIMVISILGTDFIHAIGAFASAIGSSIPIAFAFISRLRDL